MNPRVPTAFPPAVPAPTPSAANAARSDAENQRLIEEARARHKTLSENKIRSEHDVRTLSQAIEDALAEAKATFGTDDLDALRAIVLQNHHDNTAATDAYLKAIAEVETAVQQVETAAKAS
jgi:sugar (pentulose or hexulose) kinase